MTLGLLFALALSAAPPATTPPDRAGAYYHFSLAQQARLAGDTDTALAEYRRSQRLDPGSGAIRAEVARLLREAGRFEEALAEAREAVALEPESAEAHRVLGQLYQMKAASPDAEEALRSAAAEYAEVVRLEPNDGHSLRILASLYTQLREHADAARVLEQYLSLDPGYWEGLLELGSHYLALGDSERAAAALRRAVELQPSAHAYQSLGDIYSRAEQTENAILNYRQSLELDPGNLAVRLKLGELLFEDRRYQEALGEAGAVIAADEGNGFALDLKGRALRELLAFDEANAVAERLLAADPSDLKAAYLKVTIAEKRRDYAAAAAELEKVLGRSRAGEDPKRSAGTDRVFLVHLGFAYQQLGRHADAVRAFERAKGAGNDPEAPLLGYHVDALILAKDWERALDEVRAARRRFPGNVEMATQEATILRERGDLQGALAILDELRRQSPRDVDVLLGVAGFHQRARRLPDAEAALREARELEPQSLRTLFQLGAVLERQSRHDEAELVFREALTVDPNSAPVLNYLGYMNVDRGVRLEEALALIERALEIDPGNGAYLDSLGWALYRLGRIEEAETQVRKALEQQGNNAVVLDHLGDILERRGRVGEALEFWNKALAGEDDGDELDRERVERKIREAQSTLDDR